MRGLTMFNIENGREHFYQWDSNQRLIISDNTITEVHYCNRTDDCSLVVNTYTENGLLLADVPNILLQDNWDIRAYAYCNGCYTKQCALFKVIARTKPADYVYTETEVLRWETLEAEVRQIVADNNQAIREEVEENNALIRDEVAVSLDNLGNTLVGTVKGTNAVRIDDVSPILHNIKVNTDCKLYGKNLVDDKVYSKDSWDDNYCMLDLSLPGGITLTGSCKWADESNKSGYLYLRYTLDDGENWVGMSGANGSEDWRFAVGSRLQTIKMTTIEGAKYGFYSNNVSNVINNLKEIQLEVGKTATAYEEYKEPTDSVVSVYPTTTIIADNPGVEIEATYSRDINKAFAELQNTVLSMGGNI